MSVEISTSKISGIEAESNNRCIGNMYRLNESKEYRIYITSIKDPKIWTSQLLLIPKDTIISVLEMGVNEFHPNIFHGSIDFSSITDAEMSNDFIIYGIFDFNRNLTFIKQAIM